MSLHTESDRDEFVKRVVAGQVDVATVLTAPHFYAESGADVDLNLDLVARTAAFEPAMTTRAVITAPRLLFEKLDPMIVAKRYRLAGASQVDLRLTPLGGHDDGPRKVASALEIAEAFTAAPLRVVLGMQGHIGPPAIALGIVDAFSVGIGYREQVNFKSLIYSQQRPSPDDGEWGSPAGILLPGPDLTVRRSLGRHLLSDTKLRGRLGVETELLADPMADPRRSYLQSRQKQVDELLKQPANWRVRAELERLRRAIEIREVINDYHLPDGSPRLKTRTLESLRTVCTNHLQAA